MTAESARHCILRQWRPRHREASRRQRRDARRQPRGRDCLKWKPLGVNLLTTAHLAFACFQCDFLGEHNVSDWQTTNWHETQPVLDTASFVDLADVDGGPGIDSVPLSAVAPDDLEVTLSCELLALRLRQPFSQHPQGPPLGRGL